MNLIERVTKESVLSSFRTVQYSRIPDMLITGVDYLTNLGLEFNPILYDGTIDSLQYIEDVIYSNIKHYSNTIAKLKLVEDKNTWFFALSIPDLIQGMFFKLNSVHYIPLLYMADEPIVLKENSMVMHSLFQPLTLYFAQNRVIFMGINIVLTDFLQLITSNWDQSRVKDIEKFFNIDIHSGQLQHIVSYLSGKLNTGQTVEEIKDKIDLLFFDNWTRELYEKFYNFTPTVDNVINAALDRKMTKNKISFIDLRHKRLTFIEPFMRPYTKAIGDCAKGLLKGHNIKSLKLNMGAIIKHFFSELNGNVIYDTTNGFSGILGYKATFKNPYGQGQLPREVSSIHWTHRDRICPNSITNSDPGQTISLVPDQDIDLQYGIFNFTQEELNRED